MFDKILIANRGEIAVRIIRTCKKLGIGTVAVYSEEDARSLYVKMADEAVFIGGARPSESYLNKQKIIDAALNSNCQAIHPGYGFLSENAEFSKLTSDAGLVFVGPSPAAIAALGDKIVSKNMAIKAGVPTVPGHNRPVADIDEAIAQADSIGYPVLLKPAAGGGGKGMRIVYDKDGIEDALLACKKETIKSFGDDQIFVERYIPVPRHIEIQIIADNHGNVVYLVERECSIQRRYQKIIEETPSVAVDDLLREKMGKLSCAFAREAGYTNVGTVEFILDANKNFYFLEMNTRLQVEHPVTEMVTGLDLVELQFKIASGEPLEMRQKDCKFSGWAIEARICAEDPSMNFMPSTGIVTRYFEPRGKNVRVDSGIQAGSMIGVYYDSLLAKIICHGETREDALATLTNALNGYHIEGFATNLDFVNAVINHHVFLEGDISTDFLDKYMDASKLKPVVNIEHLHHAAIAAALVYHNKKNLIRLSLKPMAAQVGATATLKDSFHYIVKGGDDVFDLIVRGDQESRNWEMTVDGVEYKVVTPKFEFYRRRLGLKINGKNCMFRMQNRGNFVKAAYCGICRTYEIYSPREWELASFMPEPRKRVDQNILVSSMPGMIVEVKVEPGEIVHRGQQLLIIESMKMESGVASQCDARVSEILVSAGQPVETGDILIKFSKI
jgi:propionyl-CoA carboxylase alpha chain